MSLERTLFSDCVVLLGVRGEVLWSSESAVRLLSKCGASENGRGEDALASAEALLAPIRDAHEKVAAGGLAEVDGESWFSDEGSAAFVAHWRLSAIEMPAGGRAVLLHLVPVSSQNCDSNAAGNCVRTVSRGVPGFLRWVGNGRLVDANPVMARMLGYRSPSDMMRRVKNVGDDLFLGSGEFRKIEAKLEDAGSVEGSESALRRADGSVVWVGIYARAVYGPDGASQNSEASMFEISKQRRAEEEALRFSNQLRALTVRMHDVREEERTSIARELHDELGKDLTLLTLDLAWLRERSVKGNMGEVHCSIAEKIDTMERTIQTTLQTVRRMLSTLRPPLLDELGLKEAVEYHVQEFSKRMGIRYDFHATPITIPPGKTRIAVFRILQEVLTNVARHSKASRIRVELVQTDSALVLTVEDNGRGISKDTMGRSHSFGLLGIRERAWSLGGDVEIRAGAPSGTRVEVRVPIVSEAVEGALAEMQGAGLDSVDSSGNPVARPQVEFPFIASTEPA